MNHEPAEGVDDAGDAGFMGEDLRGSGGRR